MVESSKFESKPESAYSGSAGPSASPAGLESEGSSPSHKNYGLESDSSTLSDSSTAILILLFLQISYALLCG